MKTKVNIFAMLLIMVVFIITVGCSEDKITVSEKNNTISIENEALRIEYDLLSGYYKCLDKKSRLVCVDSAYAQVSGLKTTDELIKRTWESFGGQDETSLLITNTNEKKESLLLKFTLSKDSPFVLFTAGVNNQSDDTLFIREISPLAGGRIFKGKDVTRNLHVLDGNGGGEPTYMRQEPSLICRNNMLVYFGDEEEHYSLVMGGVSYNDFEKLARIGTSIPHLEKIRKDGVKGLKMLTYMDLGAEVQKYVPEYSGAPVVFLERGSNFSFRYNRDTYMEARTVAWTSDSLTFSMSGLEKEKLYSAGVVWCDDGGRREQSIFLQNGNDVSSRIEVARKHPLPDITKSTKPEMVLFQIPQQISSMENPKIIIRGEAGPNTVVSEFMIFEGQQSSGNLCDIFPVEAADISEKNPVIQLFASDGVGKRVDPHTSYMADNDMFYLDYITRDPFESLETYGKTFSVQQDIKPNYYYFPSICLWYAMEPYYGGVGTIATNDSPGAVEEMERVNRSGWLKYTTMAIRLVPDCYAENNENGWWDDEHWRMHGSGTQNPLMKLKSGHYREPYETTAKWGKAITDLGGIPLMYFQTAVRSKDYVEKYHEHMLFNQSYYKVGLWDQFNMGDWDRFNKGYSTYDFTDKDFSAHMRDVYGNLKEGGVRGLMYDYPFTGWADFGGMDDKYATAGSHYRRLFELAKEGLGDDCYLHERNLMRGSDITLGLVASQRIWGDTDIVTPEMISKGGLRWYKNRVVVCYDMDAKNLIKVKPNNQDGLQKMLTMCYVASSRLLLANSFCMLNDNHIYTLSRVFPFHSSALTARPIDMLKSKYSQIYSFKIDDNWQQVIFYNYNDTASSTVSLGLSESNIQAGLGLDSKKSYYIYDFWNDCLVGKYTGGHTLSQTLRPGEARVMSVRAVEKNPQILSTNRHLMQGYVELSGIIWDVKTGELKGKAQLIGDEPMKIVIALNGHKIVSGNAGNTKVSTEAKGDLAEITMTNDKNETVSWTITFAKK